MPSTTPPTKSCFRTTILSEAAVLRSLDYSLLGTEQRDDCIELIFDDPLQDAADTLRRHYNRELRVASFDLTEAFAWSKTIVFSARRRAGIPSYKGGVCS